MLKFEIIFTLAVMNFDNTGTSNRVNAAQKPGSGGAIDVSQFTNPLKHGGELPVLLVISQSFWRKARQFGALRLIRPVGSN